MMKRKQKYNTKKSSQFFANTQGQSKQKRLSERSTFKKASKKIFTKIDNAPYQYREPEADFSILLSHYKYANSFAKSIEKEGRRLWKSEEAKLNTKLNANHVKTNFHNRINLTNELIITIDGEDAKDFDDGISLKKISTPDQNKAIYELGVHIADVSHYLKKDSELDLETARRATSVYLPEVVLPMLPFALSNHLCSLVAGMPRLAYSCLMKISGKGKVLSYTFVETIIKVRRRFTYSEVDSILIDKQNLADRELSDELLCLLQNCLSLQKIMTQRRLVKGGIEFDLDEESTLIMKNNEPHYVQNVVLKPRFTSERIIEDLMLLANQSAALTMHQSGCGMFRNHDAPEIEKLQAINRLITLYGYKLPKIKTSASQPLKHRGKFKSAADSNKNIKTGKPNIYQMFLSQLTNDTHRKFFSKQFLFSMMQARYSEKNVGHYGLGFSYYCHFTSPIRRYPDVMVHRLLKEIFSYQDTVRQTKSNKQFVSALYSKSELKKLALYCSVEERKAEACEREYKKLKILRYLDARVNKNIVFNGTITGMNYRGFFVRDNITGIEGMVQISTLDKEMFFDPDSLVLKDYSDVVCYEVGQAVKIQIVSLNFKKLIIDFKLAK